MSRRSITPSRAAALTVTVVLTALTLATLTGCVPGPSPAPSDSGSSTPTPTATASTPLACADLVPATAVETALASPSTPADFSSLLEYPTPGDFASTVAGGIRCAWLADGSAGTYSNIVGGPGVPWLDVEILPGAATHWNSYTFGDSPGTADQTPFAGFPGAHSCGDPGCLATAPIGDAWVSVMVHDPGLGIGESLVGASSDDVLAALTPAAAAVFQTVQDATAAQLAWPATIGRPSGSDVEACASFLKTPALATALGVASIGDYQPDIDGPIVSFESTAIRAAGFVSCSAESEDFARADFVILLDGAAIVDRIAGSLTAGGPEQIDALPNQTGAETAVSNCAADRLACELWFSLGVDAIYVSSISNDSGAIATAIIDQAR
jgi:hypothetical protein